MLRTCDIPVTSPSRHFTPHGPIGGARGAREAGGPLARTKVRYEMFSSAINLYTPWFRAKGMYWSIHMERVRNGVIALKKILRKDRRIHRIVTRPHFMVAPEQWPEGLWEGILVEPPTPYEMATFIIKPPPYIKPRLLRVSLCDRAALFWWLMGTETARVEEVLGIDPVQAMRRAIYGYMEVPAAQLWFLATNPVPMCRNRQQAKAVSNVFQGIAQPNPTFRSQKDAIARVVGTPYFKSQLLAGRPLVPVERPLYAPGIVWRSIAHKEEDYMDNPELQKRARYHKFERQLSDKKKPLQAGNPEGAMMQNKV